MSFKPYRVRVEQIHFYNLLNSENPFMRSNVKPGDHLFGRFEVVELISKRLRLWRARDIAVDQIRLLAIHNCDGEDVEYLHRSIKQFHGVSAPALIPVYEILSDEEWIALVMGGREFLLLSLEKPLSHRKLTPRISTLSRSLNLLHERGIHHGCVDYSFIFCSTSGDLALLPPISRPTAEDDAIGLGRLFMTLLTAGKASEDLAEPNHCSELLAEREPLPALLNQLIADMVVGNTVGMRYIVQRLDEIERMGKITRTDELPVNLRNPFTATDSRSRRLILPVLTFLILLSVIITIIFWIRWAEIKSSDAEEKSDSTISPSIQRDNTGLETNPDKEHPVSPPALPIARETSVAKNAQPKKPVVSEFSELSPKVESALDDWLAAYRDLERVGGDEWGGDNSKQIIALAEKAEEALLNKDFKNAEMHYLEASTAARSLHRERYDRLAKLIETGMAALEAKRAADAANAFRLALLIDPEHQEATIGSQRAKTLDQVTTLTRKAAKFEVAGQFGIARALFLEGLSLDPFSQESKDGVKRIDVTIGEAMFRKLITDIFRLIEEDKLEQALAILNEAAALRPSAPAIPEATKILHNIKRIKILQGLQDKAIAAEMIQNWQLAHGIHTEILQRIPDSKAAQDGKLKAETIIRLKAELSYYLSEPGRLLNDDLRISARLILEEVRELPETPDELKSSAAKLMAMIQMAEEPVLVTLLSDGETEVTVQRVRKLGKFNSHELSLRPGSYTVVGTREGHRDVRHTLSIEPGVNSVQLTVSCDESIF